MTWNELRILAEARGYRLVKHGKKHDKYFRPEDGSRILLERHWSQEIRTGLLNALRKEMGL